jgi:hypothetical protein
MSSNEEVEVEDIDIEVDEEDDTTDWKAEAEKYKGIANRYKSKLDKAKTAPEKKETKETNKELTFDYGQKAYLIANGIKGKEETDFVKNFMEKTGKDLDEVLDNKYFMQELKDFRDDKTAKEAMPSGTKRSGQSGRDSVEYWIAKGELPPNDQVELRRQVVNAKIKSQGTTNVFSARPVVR